MVVGMPVPRALDGKNKQINIMKQGDNVLYQGKKYMVFATKGGYVTIGNGD